MVRLILREYLHTYQTMDLQAANFETWQTWGAKKVTREMVNQSGFSTGVHITEKRYITSTSNPQITAKDVMAYDVRSEANL